MTTYYPINENLARASHDMRSMSTYPDGYATREYRASVDKAAALVERCKAATSPYYHGKLDALLDRYARRLAQWTNDYNRNGASCPSILVSGGSNFPVKKKQRQNAREDSLWQEYKEIEAILHKIKTVGSGPVDLADPHAREMLTDQLQQLQNRLDTGKAMNAYYRKHKTLEGCPELTAEQVEKVKASMSQDWRKDPVPFPSYLLTNNNANIRRVRQRIEELSHKAEFVGWTFPSGEAKVNEAENRLQLIFEDKPDADTRQALKSESFKWAPSQGAWQRQLNQHAIRAAARLDFLRPEDGKSPYQLQPFAKRAEKDVSR